MNDPIFILVSSAALMFLLIGGLSMLAHFYTLNGIKSKTVGDGQHGMARFLTKELIKFIAKCLMMLRTGDLARNYGAIAKENYGYNIAVIDLCNPTKSDGNNLLHLLNKCMDIYRAAHSNLMAV